MAGLEWATFFPKKEQTKKKKKKKVCISVLIKRIWDSTYSVYLHAINIQLVSNISVKFNAQWFYKEDIRFQEGG